VPVKERVTTEVPGTSVGVCSGTSAQYQDDSNEMKRNLKRKSSESGLSPERGICNSLSMMIVC